MPMRTHWQTTPLMILVTEKQSSRGFNSRRLWFGSGQSQSHWGWSWFPIS